MGGSSIVFWDSLPESIHCYLGFPWEWDDQRQVQAFAGNATTDEEDNLEKQQAGPTTFLRSFLRCKNHGSPKIWKN